MERFAREWWLNLDDAISTDKYMDTVSVHRFDPPSKYRGGAGVTGLLEEGTTAATIDKCVCGSSSGSGRVFDKTSFRVSDRSRTPHRRIASQFYVFCMP